jgi:hypothetical protein
MGGLACLRSCNTWLMTTSPIARAVSQGEIRKPPPPAKSWEMALTRLSTPISDAKQVNQIRDVRIRQACHRTHRGISPAIAPSAHLSAADPVVSLMRSLTCLSPDWWRSGL